MKSPDVPIHTDLVLIGGGHAHVFVLKSFGMHPVPGVRLTLVTKDLDAPYSGMLPGRIAGHYSDAQCHINLVRLARFAGARLIHGMAESVDRKTRRIHILGRTSISYDLLSINVGITPDLSSIKGAAEHAISVKPVAEFARKWQAFETEFCNSEVGSGSVTVIGGGAAGFEIALAAHYRLCQLSRSPDHSAKVTLVAGDVLLKEHNPRARNLARKSLARRDILCVENDRAEIIGESYVQLASGTRLNSDASLVATGARAPNWFANSDLRLNEDGYVSVRTTLQAENDDDIFAVGDCAAILGHPRPKSGVFAVRQGPALVKNLRARLEKRPLRKHIPQSKFLSLLSTGNHSAIASRGNLAVSGKWVWKWKDSIDRKFINQFNQLAWMSSDDDNTETMRCAGCAAKVGPITLTRTLARLAEISDTARCGSFESELDDAVIIDSGGAELSLETIDFFRAFWDEPYLLGQIAANHALSDIYAMGGQPDRALAIAMLPHARSTKVEEDLFQLMAGARHIFDKEQVQLAGGHSAEGPELSIGFFVHGTTDKKRLLRSSNVQDQDCLIVTKPIGTGVILAAEMRGQACSLAVESTIESMLLSNRLALQTLQDFEVNALTDITGFGLAGHLLEMLSRGGYAAEINYGDLPLLPTVEQLSRIGIKSTALEENVRVGCHGEIHIENTEDADQRNTILFDPQTSGGLLASVPSELGPRCLDALLQGPAPHAKIIGRIVRQNASSTERIRVHY